MTKIRLVYYLTKILLRSGSDVRINAFPPLLFTP